MNFFILGGFFRVDLPLLKRSNFSSFKINPAVRVIVRQLSSKNCLAAILSSRHQDASPGPLGRRYSRSLFCSVSFDAPSRRPSCFCLKVCFFGWWEVIDVDVCWFHITCFSIQVRVATHWPFLLTPLQGNGRKWSSSSWCVLGLQFKV